MIRQIKKWKQDIDEITNDITDLVEHRWLFRQLEEMIRNNINLNKDNLFWDFLRYNYVASMVLGICRQIDSDKNSISLLNLLSDISSRPETLTKEWFISTYENGRDGEFRRLMLGQGIKDFEDNFGKNKFVDSSMVDSDMSNLLGYTREIKKFRNKRVAHKDKNKKLKFDVDFAVLDEAVNIVEKTAIKYNLLLNQSGYPETGLLPVVQYDWQEIFTLPWMNKSEPRDTNHFL